MRRDRRQSYRLCRHVDVGRIGAMQIAIGVVISFTYILFTQFSKQFAIGGLLPVMAAVWLPNVVFLVVAIYLLRLAPR